MADLVNIKVEGVNEFMVKLKLLDDKVRGNIKVAMSQAVRIIQAQAKLNIGNKVWHTRSKTGYRRGFGRTKIFYPEGSAIVGHVQTGDLRRSIQVKVGYVSMYVLKGVIGTDQAYAPYVEAHPEGGFLEPALIEKQNEAWGYFKRAFRSAIVGRTENEGQVPGEGGEE